MGGTGRRCVLAGSVVIATAFIAGLAFAQTGNVGGQNSQTAVCPTDSATVIDAYKTPTNPLDAKDRSVALGDHIIVEIDGSEKLITEACKKKPITLFLNGLAIKEQKIIQPKDATSKRWSFHLVRSESARDAWTILLGSPSLGTRPMTVSIGFDDQYPINIEPGKAQLQLQVLPGCRLGSLCLG